MTQVKYNMKSKYGSPTQTKKDEKISRQKNKAVSPIENKKVVADKTALDAMNEEMAVLENNETSSDKDVTPVELDEWLDLLEEVEDDDEKEIEQEEEEDGDDSDIALNYFAIDSSLDRANHPEPGERLQWPDWTNYDGHDTFQTWPQDNARHRENMRRKYGVSYVRTDKYSLERLCEPWNDTAEGFPSMEGSYGQEYSNKT
jgi:hypothetical protein